MKRAGRPPALALAAVVSVVTLTCTGLVFAGTLSREPSI